MKLFLPLLPAQKESYSLVRLHLDHRLLCTVSLVFAAGTFLRVSASAAEIIVKSPNRSIAVVIDTTTAGQLTQSVRIKEQAVFAPSAVGITVDDQSLGQKSSPGKHDATLPFVRYVQGPADFTPTEFRPGRVNHSSWGHELAQAVVYTSPFLCFGGRPEDYLTNAALPIIKAIPATWDETIVLPCSEIGSVAAFARRKGNDWFIGVINGNEAQTLSLDLNFLGKGTYHIERFADKTEPDPYAAWNQSQGDVTRKDHFSIVLRPDGGFVSHITKK